LPHKVDDISIGDVFLNYVKREGNVLGQWVSAERIVGPYYYDNKPIYKDGVWPHRWPVEPIRPRYIYGSGLIGRELVNEMEMFRGVSNWGLVLVWMVGKEIPRHDGKLLMERLNMGNPVHY